jgi:hypothetical protein
MGLGSFLLTMIIMHEPCQYNIQLKQRGRVLPSGAIDLWGNFSPAKTAALVAFGNEWLRVWAAKMTGWRGLLLLHM